MFVAKFLETPIHLDTGLPQGPAHPSKVAKRTWVRLATLSLWPYERMIVRMARRPWSFKEDRRLMELAKSLTTLEEAAKQLGRSTDAVKRMALRLGLTLKSKRARKR